MTQSEWAERFDQRKSDGARMARSIVRAVSEATDATDGRPSFGLVCEARPKAGSPRGMSRWVEMTGDAASTADKIDAIAAHPNMAITGVNVAFVWNDE